MIFLKKTVLCLLLWVPGLVMMTQSAMAEQTLDIPSTIQGEALRMPATVREVYAARASRFLWMTGNSLSKKTKTFLKTLSNISEEGLNPADYHLPLLDHHDKHDSSQKLSPGEMEVLLTDAYVSLAHDLAFGRFSPQPRFIYWHSPAPETSFFPRVLESLEAGDPVSRLDHFSPKKNGYDRLKKALSLYRKLDRNEAWPVIPPGRKLVLGDQGERVRLLRKRLVIAGELPKGDEQDDFDAETEEALKRFQEKNELEPDGAVGDATLKYLNATVDDRIRTLTVNMERRRWVADTLGDRHVFVNIPDFHLYAVDGGKTRLSMNVVVGLGREWQTPSLSSQITHLILNPQWHVPTNIIKKELMSKIRANPDYVGKERMKAYYVTENGTEPIDPATFNWTEASPSQLRLVQKEGAGNALGRIKFMFSNPFDIYLHDTPQQRFFARWMRALSHGCVRVEKPLDLAEFVMENSEMSREAIERAIARGTNQSVPLKDPIPVHILYWTAWADSDGRVHFRNDVYGKDAEVARVLGL